MTTRPLLRRALAPVHGRRRPPAAALLAAVVLAAHLATGASPGGAAAAPQQVPPAPRTFGSDAFPTYDLGPLVQTPRIRGRDAGASGTVGGMSLWAFGDTVFPAGAPAADGRPIRTNTGAHDLPSYYPVQEPLDSTGAPSTQLIPYTAGEAAHNASTSESRYAVWPSSVVPRGDGHGLVFYKRAIQRDDLSVQPGTEAVGIADVAPGSTVATRRPGWIFGPNDCQWGIPFLAPDGYIYLYAELNGANSGCPDRVTTGFLDFPTGVARVARAAAGSRSAYRFWNGSAWVVDQMQTAKIPNFNPMAASPSVAWNPTLGRYLALTGIGDESRYATAPSPQGPWDSEDPWELNPFVRVTGSADGSGTRAYRLHPELGPADGSLVVFSYHRVPVGGGGEIRLVAVDLRTDHAARLEDHVARAYQATVGWSPNPVDRAYWAGRLRDRALTTAGLAHALQFSPDGYRAQVRERYQTVLGRAADAGGLAHWTTWMMANPARGHDDLTVQLVSLAEFQSQHSTASAFVSALYPIALGRPADPAGHAYWTSRLSSGSITRAALTRTLLRSVEAARHQARGAYTVARGRAATATEVTFVAGDYARVAYDPAALRVSLLTTADAVV